MAKPEAKKIEEQDCHAVEELTTSYGSGELNELKEKLNELIRATK